MMFSTRVPADLAPNRLTLAERAIRARGGRLIDLTETNPTRVGLAYPQDAPAALDSPAVAELRPAAVRTGQRPRGGRRDHPVSRPTGRPRAGDPDREHERGVLVPLQAALRPRRPGAGAGAQLPALRAPHAARAGRGPAVPARVPRHVVDRRRTRSRRRRSRAHARRPRRQPEQPDRLDADARRPLGARLVLRVARPRARRRRGVLRLPDRRSRRTSPACSTRTRR